MADYSGKLLIDKLGYKPGDSVMVLDMPAWQIDDLSSHGIKIRHKLPATWAHAFFADKKSVAAFRQQFDLSQINKALWVSWPKKSVGNMSEIKTDLTEQVIRDNLLPLGWVDIKVAAIDSLWSGLKFTRRKA